MSEITDEITEQEMAVIEQIAETVAKAVFQNIAKMARQQQQTGKNLSGNVTDRTNQIAQALTKAIYQNVMRAKTTTTKTTGAESEISAKNGKEIVG
mgnify:CR=1 FL=1